MLPRFQSRQSISRRKTCRSPHDPAAPSPPGCNLCRFRSHHWPDAPGLRGQRFAPGPKFTPVSDHRDLDKRCFGRAGGQCAPSGPPAPWRPLLSGGLCPLFRGDRFPLVFDLDSGRFFTVNVAIASDHQLVESGPYRYLRHPTYTGALLAFLGLGLCMGNLVSLGFIVIPIFLAFRRRMRVEEEALLGAFGDKYRTYMQRTRRLLPFVY
ncbi:MAG: isoprenylcysteine carboxylmethyltransferase family protein [Opitutaceae bacterium]|nr:isoprenylcysteine carboxylmethyltransferase family protein [Opitutaceae bacterium]